MTGDRLKNQREGFFLTLDHVFFWALLVLCVVIFFLFIQGSMRDVLLRFVPDDAFYYFGIAEQWAKTGQSTFDGVNLTNGYHPLWQGLLIIPAYWVSDIESFARMASAAGVALVFFSAVLLSRTLKNQGKPMTFFPYLWIFATLALASVYGLESPLSLALFSALIFFFPARPEDFTVKRAMSCGLISGLLFLSRIDALIWVITFDALVGLLAWRASNLHPVSWKFFVTLLVIQGGMIGGFFLYNFMVWGHLLSVSALVKAGRADFFSFDVPFSLLFILAVFLAVFSAADLVLRGWRVFRQGPLSSSFFWSDLLSWLSLSNVLYVGVILVTGGRETYNWYFVNVVLSGAVLFPAFLAGKWVPLPRSRVHWRMGIVILIIGFSFVQSLQAKITQASDFVSAYDKAKELARLPQGSVTFASGDCGILGTVSRQHCFNTDGLTNSFEYQSALSEDRLATWFREKGLNAFFTNASVEPIKETFLTAHPGIDGVGRSVRLGLEPWPHAVSASFSSLRLYRVIDVQPMSGT